MMRMKVGIVGATGLVGEELVRLLREKKYIEIIIFPRSEVYDFSKIDILFLSTPASISKKLAPLAINSGATVIDLSSAFRNDPNVPLILSPVNRHILENNPKLIACPNCIVAILLMVLAPLHEKYQIKKMQITTYQAASGAGKEGLFELLENKTPSVFPYSLTNNLFLHESPQLETGYSEEEEKIIFETKKILNDHSIKVNVRSVRVSTLRAHSIAVNVSFKKEPKEAMGILKKVAGITFHPSPHPKLAENKEEIYFGPIRKDLSTRNALDLWIVGDQLLRGAALTATEISDTILNNSSIK
jgi:aspartate-semialdehyde dehydrogenase